MIRIFKNKTSKKAGFTLLEMVLVIAIMMIMSVYGILSIQYQREVESTHDHLRNNRQSRGTSKSRTYHTDGFSIS